MGYNYDLVVIGGGAGGLTAAKMAHGLSKRVALIEKQNRLGGECTWTGCIPSKALIKVAHVAHEMQHLGQYGLQINETVALDTSQVMSHVRAIIQEDYQSHTPEKIRKLGIDVLFGNASFRDAHTIQLDERALTFNKAIITTGSRPFIPPIDGLDTVSYLTNETLFLENRLPRSMIIVGGGAIGAEMASALNRLGVAVTIVEQHERMLMHDDAELVGILAEIMRKEGVTITTDASVMSVRATQSGITAVLQSSAGREELQAEKILLAVGRMPNVEGLGLERIGVRVERTGIMVNKHLQTDVPNIYAAGDVVGPYRFSHMAWHQAVIAVRNAFIPLIKQAVDYQNVLWATFTAPELASAGMTEEEARTRYGDTIVVYRVPYRELDRAVTDRTTNGMAKFICDRKGYLLGIHILGAHASDIVHEAQLIKSLGRRFDSLQGMIHIYPTYAELIWKGAKTAYIKRLESSWIGKLLKKLFLQRKP